MVRFLTDEWVLALDRAAQQQAVEPNVALCIQYAVDDVRYHLRLTDGSAHFHPGRAADANVTFTATTAIAQAIARGELSAQRAFMNGALHIEGDTIALSSALGALRAIGDVFAHTRDETEWRDA